MSQEAAMGWKENWARLASGLRSRGVGLRVAGRTTGGAADAGGDENGVVDTAAVVGERVVDCVMAGAAGAAGAAGEIISRLVPASY